MMKRGRQNPSFKTLDHIASTTAIALNGAAHLPALAWAELATHSQPGFLEGRL